jgi:hypothetical protein
VRALGVGGRPSPVAIAATVAIVAMSLAATGDVLLAAVLLGVAAGRVEAGVVAVLAAGATIVRWGSPSLTAIGADQAVLGAAGVVGPAPAAAAAWCAAIAVVVGSGGRPFVPLAAGTLGALLVAGPTDAAGSWVRVAATVAAVAVAWTVGRVVPRRPATAVALVAAAAAFVLAVAA